jgi:hypothetical protein
MKKTNHTEKQLQNPIEKSDNPLAEWSRSCDMKKYHTVETTPKSNRNFFWPSGSVIWKEIIRGKIDTSNTQIHHRRSWHGLTTHLFSNFLFTNLFSIKFLYFFIISALFPYFNLFVSIFIQSYANIKLHVSSLSTLYRYL